MVKLFYYNASLVFDNKIECEGAKTQSFFRTALRSYKFCEAKKIRFHPFDSFNPRSIILN